MGVYKKPSEKAIEGIDREFKAGYATGGLDTGSEDLSFIDLSGPTAGSASAAAPVNTGNTMQSLLSEEDLDHLALGCFVRVGLGDSSYWAEIGQIDGNMVSGMVHPELSGSLCIVDHDSCEIARFSRNQITELGCNRYCFC